MKTTERQDQTFGGRVLITIGLVVFTILVVLLVYFTFDVILLVFAAVLLAIFLRGLAELLGRFVHLSEGWRVMIVSVVLVAINLRPGNGGSESNLPHIDSRVHSP